MKKYHLRVLGNGNYDETLSIECTNLYISSSGGFYQFYNVSYENEIQKNTDIAFYPINRTIIEQIDIIEK